MPHTQTAAQSEDLITRYTQIIERQDGSEVKLVATAYFGTGLHRSVGVDVFKRQNADQPWSLCNDRPDPRWREMSVEQHIREGRSEVLRTVSHGEILKVAGMIGKPMSAVNPPADAAGEEAQAGRRSPRP